MKFEIKVLEKAEKCKRCEKELPLNEWNLCEQCDKRHFNCLFFKDGVVLESVNMYGSETRIDVANHTDADILHFLKASLKEALICRDRAEKVIKEFQTATMRMAGHN